MSLSRPLFGLFSLPRAWSASPAEDADSENSLFIGPALLCPSHGCCLTPDERSTLTVRLPPIAQAACHCHPRTLSHSLIIKRQSTRRTGVLCDPHAQNNTIQLFLCPPAPFIPRLISLPAGRFLESRSSL
ncbi:hypothetical protein CIHG_00315 [Coccidioides immitis H538.4]|uniref:Secreted protein n=1 Tax=Coccidioides immitis H538.4 TaxID=396776 RepID=A0A0J8REZ3_COCIT|nr:hypothetical protein CIHG_00315 [Coccidioides immitis H538.4]